VGIGIDPGNRAIPAGLPAETLFHPLFLYEMLWNFAGAILLVLLLVKLRVQWGQLFAGYLIWYSVGRFFMEFIRLDANAVFFGIRVNQWAAVAAILLGLVIILVQRSRHPGLEPSVYRPGKEWEDETEVDFEERWDVNELLASDTEKTTSKSTTSGPSSTDT
jgi:Prolipoprotein diacylglyceryltransferase